VRERKLVIGLLTTLAVIGLVVLRGADLWNRRTQILRAGDRRAENLALILAGYVRQNLGAGDAALRQLALLSQRVGGPGAPDAEWLPALQGARVGLTAVGAITVVDSAGIIRHATQPAIIGQSRREQFVFERLSTASADRLVADRPFRAFVPGRPFIIPIARRLTTPTGAFDGIVVASFYPDSLRAFFRTVDVGRRGAVSAFHDGGVVLFREPSDSNPIGEQAKGNALFEAAQRGGGSGLHRGRMTPTGPMLRTAFHSLDEQRVIVAVSLSEDELLADWIHDARMSIGIGTLLLLLAIALVVLLYRQMDVRHSAEQALIRSQRLESLGQLTGGVAHDFNNLLTVVLGNVSLMKTSLEGTPLASDDSLNEIERAARRAADLTRQLLAFARRQPLLPRVVDLSESIVSAEPMLRRVVGEGARFRVARATEPCLANVDPVQIETALLNLCMNARDAMTPGGTLIVETGKAHLDEDYARNDGDVTPGRYVFIAVSDTGTGIPADHLPRLFEPFFTTKAPGKGTGLGLSMVYGFVKQSGGHVKVYSEVGRGTSVKMYFPETTGTPAVTTPAPDEDPRGNGEVVLLVEDEPLVRALGARMLHRLGYLVLEAEDGEKALAIAASDRTIDLLFTDVMLPGQLTGPVIAREVVTRRPDIRVLFASGYSREMIELGAQNGMSVQFLSKPYDRAKLAKAVREALREARPAAR
jgi:signal transduction histidine kinase/ActR/RegA family two-component response regulator